MRSWNWRKNSAKGDPGGNWNGRPWSDGACTSRVVEMLTTAGETCSARSAKEAGGAAAAAMMVGPATAMPASSSPDKDVATTDDARDLAQGGAGTGEKLTTIRSANWWFRDRK